jgi:citrate lyase subunit beta/citryl-CoA lyase
MGSGADALLLDLEDSISPANKAEARATTLAFLKEAMPAKRRPRIYVRINGLATGLTDDDLDAVVSGHPDGIMFPKAEGGAASVAANGLIGFSSCARAEVMASASKAASTRAAPAALINAYPCMSQ